jgi:fluoride exporter
MEWVAVAAGGAMGSMARYWLSLALAQRLQRPFPAGTFAVNAIGCVVIGAAAGLIAGGRLHVSPALRAFVFAGLLGGFTTFSSFALDTLTLAQAGNYGGAFANVAGQLIAGLGGVWLGFRLAW